MSKAKDFLDFWIQNSVHATEQYGTVGASQDITELLNRCIEMAASEGVTRQDIEAEVGNLDTYLRGELKGANALENNRRDRH